MEQAQPHPVLKAPRRRTSVFVEVGLVDNASMRRERNLPPLASEPNSKRLRPARVVRFRSQNEIFEGRKEEDIQRESESDEPESDDCAIDEDEADYESTTTMSLPSPAPVFTNSKMYRAGLLVLVLAMMLPMLNTSPIQGRRDGVVPRQTLDPYVVRRDDTNPNTCIRFSHQSTVVNGTLYIYGGETKTSGDQENGTWVNDFLTLDLTQSWRISKPSLTGLPKPSGPPTVALGYLWSSHDSLFLYGGEFSDQEPIGKPTAFSTWEYQIGSKQWVEHKEPKTAAGDHAVDAGIPVQRSAEGAGISVSNLGRGWYFGGHLDYLTTEGWSYMTKRVYLKSLVEFTFPGYSNNAVNDLHDGKTAGQEGVYRNVTEGGLQDTVGFTERADGLLTYIPGFGDEGLLLGLTGGINSTFTQMNIIDVYDIAKSQWYKQSTSGPVPKYRVSACAAVAAAADGSSYNVYMFGGQNLQPYREQLQYNDMWILSVPSFTWIEVDMSKQSVPYGRSGHTCHIWDGQMVVVGGYVGKDLSCEIPGIYVFNMSSLSWSDQFTALTGDRAKVAYDGSQKSGNPLAQQANQRGFDSKAGLQGSYGYAVPAAVQSVIGGNQTGGATLTAPVESPTEGPFQSGKPYTYTVTGADGAIITETAAPGAAPQGSSGPNIGAIIAGVIAGVFAVIAVYFAFCAWIYRKRVQIWKNHAGMVAARSEKPDPITAGIAGATINSSAKNSTSERYPRSSAGGSRAGPGASGGGNGSGGAVSMPYEGAAGVAGGSGSQRRDSDASSIDDLLSGQEPSFWGPRGVLLNPRRSLRVINRD